ncbi:MAG: hypothetical protein ACMG6S_21570, partial [Byssovorax sp.]
LTDEKLVLTDEKLVLTDELTRLAAEEPVLAAEIPRLAAADAQVAAAPALLAAVGACVSSEVGLPVFFVPSTCRVAGPGERRRTTWVVVCRNWTPTGPVYLNPQQPGDSNDARRKKEPPAR